MNRVQQILALLADGQPRTVEQIMAVVPVTDRTQALGSIGHMLKRSHLTSSHTYTVTVEGLRAAALRPLSAEERRAQDREAKRRKAQLLRENGEKYESDRMSAKAKREAAKLSAQSSRAARGIVAAALTNPHPLHAAWGGARQGAGA